MLDGAQSSVVTKFSGRSVAETVDRLGRFIADRGFTLFRVIGHSGAAGGVGVRMPDSKLVMFGNPVKGRELRRGCLACWCSFGAGDTLLTGTTSVSRGCGRRTGALRHQGVQCLAGLAEGHPPGGILSVMW